MLYIQEWFSVVPFFPNGNISIKIHIDDQSDCSFLLHQEGIVQSLDELEIGVVWGLEQKFYSDENCIVSAL